MTTVATFGPTGNPYVDGVLTGVKWAVNSLTYSFPTRAVVLRRRLRHGEQLNDFRRSPPSSRTRSAASSLMYSAVANVTFTEVTETARVHGDLRYAESDLPSTAWAYYPSTSAAGGDAWFNNSTHWYDSPAKGNYALPDDAARDRARPGAEAPARGDRLVRRDAGRSRLRSNIR